MMKMGVTHERPGVYSSYDASSVVHAGGGAKVVGLAASKAGASPEETVTLTTFEQAAAAFGPQEEITALAGILLSNGAAAVVAVGVGSVEEYQTAFQTLGLREEVELVVCDSQDLSVQQALRDSVEEASKARRERICVVTGGGQETVEQLTARAGQLNHSRVVLVAPGTGEKPWQTAAAVAGAIAGEADPAVPLGGAELRGLGSLGKNYSDNELDLLVRGGVTAVEQVGGRVSVIRGVTTKTTPDTTWRELTTILIVDDVIPAIRESLKAKFARSKNTPQSRGAIRAQVIVELEKKLAGEIITGYENVTVSPLEENPTVCLVDFSFTVAHGLNQIWLSAHITV